MVLAAEPDFASLAQVGPSELIVAVRDLIDLMARGGITELDLNTGTVSIRLRGNGTNAVTPKPAADVPTLTPLRDLPESEYVITAPMIGTYYAAPAPGETPFVSIGDEIEIGQVVGVIEAMKIMNEITADRAGVVTDLLVSNAQAVEYGSPLMLLAELPDGLA
ncbi:MAG: acetyl-CoA carboxylase, biotin carboxyl carrier protein [Chloroflexota bacterium]|nr:acetyl-CoA carboxylase, biotin carboxyl carrier protein [Chloroflexota bacterium]